MNIFFYINISIILVSAFLLLLVLANNPRNPKNIAYAFLLFFIIFWIFTVTLADRSVDYETAFFWSKLAIVGPIFILPSILYFALIYPRGTVSGLRTKILVFLPLILLPLTFTEENVKSVSLESWGTALEVGWLYYLYFTFFIIYFSVAAYILVKKMKTSDKKTANQIRFVLAGFMKLKKKNKTVR